MARYSEGALRSFLTDYRRRQAGFSLVEAGITVALASVIAGFTLLNVVGVTPGISANAALSQAVEQLRNGHDSAIRQRRNVELRFLDENHIQLVRDDMPAGTTTLSTIALQSKITFCLFDGVPDTPDSFGKATAVYFGGASTMTFLSDGTLVDSQGNPINGTAFLGQAGHPETARAVTILGATGRVRGYRWNKTKWINQ